MAASFDGTRITDADALSETVYVAGLWENVGGGAATLETDFFYQGSYSVSEQAKGSEDGTCFIPNSTTYNVSSNNYLFILKGIVTTSGLLATTRATGQKFEIGSGASAGSGRPSDYYQYYSYYSATYPAKESWIIHVFDAQEVAYISNVVGTSFSITAVNYWGHAATMTGSVKSNNVSMDAIEYVVSGNGMTWTGTGGSFQEFVDLDEGTTTNRWGVVTTRGSVIYCVAVLSLSDTSATTFTDSNKKIIFPWTYVAEGAQGIDVDLSNSSTEVSLSVCSFTGEGTGATKKWFDSTLDVDVNMDTIMIPSHGMSTGDHIIYSREGGSANIGFAPSVEGTTDWWVAKIDDNHVGICSTLENAFASPPTLVALTSTGNENQSIIKNPDNRIDYTVTGTSGSHDLDSCILEGVRILTLTSATTLTSGFIQSIGNVVASTGTLTGVKISEATLEEGVALFTPLANLTNVTDCEFVAAATVTTDVAARAWQVDATGPSYSDETTDFTDFGTGQTADVNLFPGTPATGDYFAIGYQRPFDSVIFNNASGTAGVGSGLTLTWEYYNGSWTSLSGVSDGTSSFTVAVSDGQVLTFTLPTDWATTSINSTEQLYYIRAYVSAGSYSTNPVYDNGWIEGDNLQQHGHAVEITSTGTFNSSGNLFTGYWDPEIDGTSNGWEFDTETGVNGTTEVITTDADHGFYSGDAIYYNNEGGTETIGLTNGNKYYAYVVSATTLKVHTTRSGAISDNSSTRVNLTASGVGNGETQALYGAHAAVFNDSSGSVTINATNSGDVPSYRNGTSASTTATAAVTIEVTGVTEGTRCVILRASDSSQLLNALAFTSDGAGAFKASTGFSYTTDTPVYVSAGSSGKVVAGVADDTAVFTDETRQANDSRTGAGNTMTLFPTTTPASPDGFYYGHTEKFSQMDIDVLTAGAGTYTLAWEYWGGSSWSAVSGLSDGTNNYKNVGLNRVSWTEPGSWATTTVTNQPGTTALYYIRARFVSGTVTTTPVGRTAQLDVTKYRRWETDSVITSTGLSLKATWVEDTTAAF